MQADEFGVEDFREHLGDFGLAGAGGTFYQQRLFEREREKDRGLDALVGDVEGALEAVGDLLVGDVHCSCGLYRKTQPVWIALRESEQTE